MPGGATEFAATVITAPLNSVGVSLTDNPGTFGDQFWYSYTPIEDGAIGLRSHVTTGTNFDPNLSVYYGTPGSLNDWFFLASEDGRPQTVPTYDGVTLYIKIIGVTNLGSTAGVVITLDAYKAPRGAYGLGAIFIPDDTSFVEYDNGLTFPAAFPAAVLEAETGDVLRLQHHVPSCEAGSILPNGMMLFDSNYASTYVYLFNNDLELRHTVTPPVTPTAGGNSHHFARYDDSTFLVATRVSGSGVWLWTLADDAEIGATTWNLSASSNVAAIAVNADTGVLYYVDSGLVNQPIKRYDLVADTTLSNFVVGIANYKIVRDSLFVLSDGTLLAGYSRITSDLDMVKHYDVDGTVLHTYSLAGTDYVLDRITVPAFDDSYFVAWVHQFITPNETSRFHSIEIATGTVLSEVAPVYQSNTGIGPFLADPPRFGHSFSCPILILAHACVCQPRRDFGGGRGFSGGDRSEGQDPTAELPDWTSYFTCPYGGDVPDGVNGTDTESWLS